MKYIETNLNNKNIKIIVQAEKVNEILDVKEFRFKTNINSDQYLYSLRHQYFLKEIEFVPMPHGKIILNCGTDLFRDIVTLQSIKGLEFLDTSKVRYMDGMFRGCTDLQSLNLKKFKTDAVIDMSYMFQGCASLTSLDLSNFNTNNVTNMSNMFEYCYELQKLDLTGLDTTNLIDTHAALKGCYALNQSDTKKASFLLNENAAKIRDLVKNMKSDELISALPQSMLNDIYHYQKMKLQITQENDLNKDSDILLELE